MTDNAFAFGIGVGTHNQSGEWLEVYFPSPILKPSPALAAAAAGLDNNSALDAGQIAKLAEALRESGEQEQAELAEGMKDSAAPVVAVLLGADEAPANVPEGYLKLHLLSHRLVAPHGTKLDGLFGVLPNVAWTSEGAIAIDELPKRQP